MIRVAYQKRSQIRSPEASVDIKHIGTFEILRDVKEVHTGGSH